MLWKTKLSLSAGYAENLRLVLVEISSVGAFLEKNGSAVRRMAMRDSFAETTSLSRNIEKFITLRLLLNELKVNHQEGCFYAPSSRSLC